MEGSGAGSGTGSVIVTGRSKNIRILPIHNTANKVALTSAVFLLSPVCVCAQETYLSADDLRINLWHMEITDQSFNIVDIKPANMEELTEVSPLAKYCSTRSL